MPSYIIYFWAATSEIVPSNINSQRRFRSACAFFTGRTLNSQLYQVSSCGQLRLWLDCAGAAACLSPCWAHILDGTFSCVTSQFVVWEIVIVYLLYTFSIMNRNNVIFIIYEWFSLRYVTRSLLSFTRLCKLLIIWPKQERWSCFSVHACFCQLQLSRDTVFPTRLHVHPAKTHISLRIRAVWSITAGHSVSS